MKTSPFTPEEVLVLQEHVSSLNEDDRTYWLTQLAQY